MAKPQNGGLGRRIAEQLALAGLTQTELARRLGVSDPTVCGWIKGYCAPRAARIPDIAEALGISVGSLYGETDGTAQE